MVQSKLDKKLVYPNIKYIYPEDNKKKVFLYEVSSFDLNYLIVIGEMRNDNNESQILYCPIYLVRPNNKVIQIGLFEFTKKNYEKYIDNDLDYHFDVPLLYDFVDKNYLLKNGKIINYDENEEDEYEDIPIEISSNRKDIFTKKPNPNKKIVVSVETEIDAKNEREKYHEKKEHNWVSKWLKNKNYSISKIDNNGDCLFTCIKEAFDQINQETTIGQIRKKLVKYINDELYNDYKSNYNLFSDEIKKTSIESIQIKNDIEKLKLSLKDNISIQQKKHILSHAKKMQYRYELLKKENQLSKKLLSRYKFMKDINSIEDFKKIIYSCDFWADNWTIRTLEQLLNIKFIILNRLSFLENDYANVIDCFPEKYLNLKEDEFNPDFYIILEKNIDNYQLILYKKKSIFAFSELPYDIKRVIMYKCIQEEGETFNIIPDFQNFRNSQLRTNNNSLLNDIESLHESTLRNLYDNNRVLGIDMYGSISLEPGLGRSEMIEPITDIIEFCPLSHKEPKWRKCLSREYPCDFDLDGKKWKSVDHYYQANKYYSNKNLYEIFLNQKLENEDDINYIKALGSKSGIFKGKQIKEEETKIDPDFYGKNQSNILKKAYLAKFSQNPSLKHLLLDTKDAKLIRLRRGYPSELLDELMIIRRDLN